ncbi:RICIN domain-containing protein, partial [Actinoplanes sp. NPDC049598]|uniref:RICIN domain-containing protein n=1 Tax=Actinoplanes sp. NPDC049598 TaxID=3154626 RepID=UPI003424E82B
LAASGIDLAHTGSAASGIDLAHTGLAASGIDLAHTGLAASGIDLAHTGSAASGIDLAHTGLAASGIDPAHTGSVASGTDVTRAGSGTDRASGARATPSASAGRGGPGPVDLVGLEFQLINAASRDCLTTALVTRPCAGGDSFRWRIRPTVTGAGSLQLLNVATEKCLSIAGAATRDNARADLYPCDGHATRLWRLRDSTGETARFQNVLTGKCLTSRGDVAVQRRCTASQRWTVNVLRIPLPFIGTGS